MSMSDNINFEVIPRSGRCCEWPSITWTKLTMELMNEVRARPDRRQDPMGLGSAEHVSRNGHGIPDSRSDSCTCTCT